MEEVLGGEKGLIKWFPKKTSVLGQLKIRKKASKLGLLATCLSSLPGGGTAASLLHKESGCLPVRTAIDLLALRNTRERLLSGLPFPRWLR